MKRLLSALLLCASPAFAQANGWQEIANGWGEIQTPPGTYATLAPPAGCVAGSVGFFLGSPVIMSCDAGLTFDAVTNNLTATGEVSGATLKGTGLTAGRVPLVGAAGLITDDAGLAYNTTTNSLDVADGRVQAANFNAIPLATPGSITVTPRLTQVGSITTVAGSALVDGDYFTIRGTGASVLPIEFDASPGDGTTGGRVAYVFGAGDTADQIRDGLITLINGATVTTHVVASSGGAATVTLTIDSVATAGGSNTENVTNAGFGITGFADPTHATTVTYKLVALLPDGTTTEAGAASTTAAATATLSASNSLRLTWSSVSGAASYRVYRTVAPTTPNTTGIIYSGTALTVDDTGLAGGGETAPTANTTGTATVADIRFTGTTSAGLHLKSLTTTQRNALAGSIAGDQIYNSTNQRVEAYGSAGWQGRVGVLNVNTVSATTTGTSEEVLATYTLPAGALSADGKAIRITAFGTKAANTNSITNRIRFGGIGGTIIAQQAFTTSASGWRMVADVIRTGAATQEAAGTATSAATATIYSAPTQTLSNAIDIVMTSTTATAPGDCTFKGMIVEALN